MDACGWTAALLIGLMAILVGADVTLRLFNMGNLGWANEVIEYMITGATFVGAPWVLHHHGHVNIDIIVGQLPLWARARVEILGDIVCLLISSVMLFESVYVLIDTRESGAVMFKTLVFPEWYLIVPAVICFGLFVLEFADRLWRTAKGHAR
jgi:TRAP-type C4-dicarboxylate transport system permease small subunit